MFVVAECCANLYIWMWLNRFIIASLDHKTIRKDRIGSDKEASTAAAGAAAAAKAEQGEI